MIDEKIGIGLVGISLNNSYFNSDIITQLISVAYTLFKEIKIIIPDTLSTHNYIALGDSLKAAEKMVRQKGNNIKNKCVLAIQDITKSALKVPDIIRWEYIEKSPFYHNQLKKIHQLYNNNVEFKQDVRKNTRQVIISKICPTRNVKQSIDEGIQYILKEFAFLMAAPEIFNCSKVAFIYYKKWELLQNFINGKYDSSAKENIGYVIIS